MPPTPPAPHLHSAGVSVIELLLVIAIISLLGAATTPFVSRFVLQTQYDTTQNMVVSQLRKAQTAAFQRKQDATWGVCYTGGTLRLFSGSCGSPSYSENYSVPSSVSVTGLTTITFDARGEPSSTATINLSTSIESGSVAINSAGGLNIN